MAVGHHDDGHGEVVAVDEGEVVEGLLLAAVEGEFGEGGGWCAGTLTGFKPSAVACRACDASTVATEGAVGSAPDTALPVRGDVFGLVLAARQLEAGVLRSCASLRVDGGPDGVTAPIGHDERRTSIPMLPLCDAEPVHMVVDVSRPSRRAWKIPCCG